MMQNERISLHDELSGKTYLIDKYTLCTVLPYFNTLFNSGLADAQATSFNIPRLKYTTPKSAKLLVDYCLAYEEKDYTNDYPWLGTNIEELLGLEELGNFYGIDLSFHVDDLFRHRVHSFSHMPGNNCGCERDPIYQVAGTCRDHRVQLYKLFNHMRIRQSILRDAERTKESVVVEEIFWREILSENFKSLLNFAFDLDSPEHQEFWTACFQYIGTEYYVLKPVELLQSYAAQWTCFDFVTKQIMTSARSSRQPRNKKLIKHVAALWNKRHFYLHSKEWPSLEASSEAQEYLTIQQLWMLFWHWSQGQLCSNKYLPKNTDFEALKAKVMQNREELLHIILATTDDEALKKTFAQDFETHLDLKCRGREPGENFLSFTLHHCDLMQHLFRHPGF